MHSFNFPNIQRTEFKFIFKINKNFDNSQNRIQRFIFYLFGPFLLHLNFFANNSHPKQ